MAEFQTAPTWAEVVLVDEKTGKFAFNPIWLDWFVFLTQLINQAGGGSGAFLHNSLSSIQGGSTTERFHLTSAQYNLVITFSDPLLLGNGSASAPTYSFSSDSDVGMYRVTTNTLGFAANGAEAWRITTTGELRGPDAATTTSAGTARTIRGGPGGSTSGNGGELVLVGGTPIVGRGGAVTITGADAAGAGNNNGGAISAIAGTSNGSGTGGNLTLAAGVAGGSGGTGGTVFLLSGGGNGTGFGGALSISSGAGGSSGNSGQINFLSGNAGVSAGDSGGISFQTGTANAGNTGSVAFITGGGSAGNTVGSISFIIGTKGAGGTDGNVTFAVSGATVLKVNGTSQHTSYLGTSPTITAGGGTSPSIVGKDQAFTVTLGTGGIATTFTVTFAKAFTNAPPAIAVSDTDIVALKCVTTTTTVVVTATAAFTASSKVHVIVGSWE